MINTRPLNFNQLARIYLVSNTPPYLYKHFRSDFSVQEFAKLNTLDDLAQELGRIAAINPTDRTLQQIVIAYACVVGLTFKKPRDVAIATVDMPLDTVVWANRILALWESSSITSETIQFQILPQIEKPRRASNDANVILIGGV